MTSPNSKVLVYLHRHNSNNPIVADGLTVMTTSDLDDILVHNSTLQRTSTPIPRGALSVEIYQRDLLTEAQKLQFADMPNYETNVAGVTVPLKVFLSKLLGSKEFEELVILSAKR